MQGSHIIPALATAIALSGCAGTAEPGVLPPADGLAQPEIAMQADPPPPHTYWAPEGSTIVNHPRQPGIWIAQIDGQERRYYFGDQCHASRYQAFIGRPVEALPQPPAEALWRFTCTTCAQTSDLAWARLNVAYEEDTRRIVEIACG